MDKENPRRRLATPFSRSARNSRIVERLRQGFGTHEIARQIVKQALEGREALESAIHAHMQSIG